MGRPLAGPRVIARRRIGYVTTPTVATAGGRVVVAWSYVVNRRSVGVQAAIGSPTALGARRTLAAANLLDFGTGPPGVVAAIDPQGPATVVFAIPDQHGNPPMLSARVLAVDGA